MFTKTIKSSQLTANQDAFNISLGDEITYIENNKLRKAEVIGCFENANKFLVNN